MTRRKVYFHNAMLLTASGLVLRMLGMGFRVVLSAYLGGGGMGLYQLILALYMVFVSLATAGINVAATRLAAQSLARGQGMGATLRGLCTTALGFGTAAMVAQALLAEPAARWLLHDIRAENALRILAPSLPFMAVSGALRGCFLASRRVTPNVVTQLIEQLVRMAVAVAGLRVLAQWGAGYGCAAVVLGNTLSEGVSCGLMLLFAARTPEFARRSGEPLHPYTRRELYEIVLPVEGSRLLGSGLQAVESSLIPLTLSLYTGSRAVAMTQYGNFKGIQETRRLIGTMLKLTGTFSLAAGACFVVFGPQLAQIVYRDAEVGHYVQILGFVAPFMYLESMIDGVLKGLGEQLATFRYSLVDSVLRIAAIALLLPRYGIAAFLGIMIASNLLTFTLNTRRMFKVAAAA